jgi:hypothetical protein
MLHVSLPARALIRIIRNGSLLTTEKNKTIILHVKEPGDYRVEAFLKAYGKYRPWIFSNPIFVTSGQECFNSLSYILPVFYHRYQGGQGKFRRCVINVQSCLVSRHLSSFSGDQVMYYVISRGRQGCSQ